MCRGFHYIWTGRHYDNMLPVHYCKHIPKDPNCGLQSLDCIPTQLYPLIEDSLCEKCGLGQELPKTLSSAQHAHDGGRDQTRLTKSGSQELQTLGTINRKPETTDAQGKPTPAFTQPGGEPNMQATLTTNSSCFDLLSYSILPLGSISDPALAQTKPIFLDSEKSTLADTSGKSSYFAISSAPDPITKFNFPLPPNLSSLSPPCSPAPSLYYAPLPNYSQTPPPWLSPSPKAYSRLPIFLQSANNVTPMDTIEEEVSEHSDDQKQD